MHGLHAAAKGTQSMRKGRGRARREVLGRLGGAGADSVVMAGGLRPALLGRLARAVADGVVMAVDVGRQGYSVHSFVLSGMVR